MWKREDGTNMWPKLLAQLFELLPHVSRLIPMADRFFASRAATDRATETAMVAMAEGVRGDLGQVTKAHAGLYRQLQEQGTQLEEVRDDLKRVRTVLEQRESRIETLESFNLPKWDTVMFTTPELARRALQESGHNFFLVSKDIDLDAYLALSPLFSPDNIGLSAK